MGQVIRQIGVVIGLTVILTFPVTVLTFPVTVVSGAGSQKHAEQIARVAGAGSKGAAQTPVVTEISWPGRQELLR
jgi:hypothetical protein